MPGSGGGAWPSPAVDAVELLDEPSSESNMELGAGERLNGRCLLPLAAACLGAAVCAACRLLNDSGVGVMFCMADARSTRAPDFISCCCSSLRLPPPPPPRTAGTGGGRVDAAPTWPDWRRVTSAGLLVDDSCCWLVASEAKVPGIMAAAASASATKTINGTLHLVAGPDLISAGNCVRWAAVRDDGRPSAPLVTVDHGRAARRRRPAAKKELWRSQPANGPTGRSSGDGDGDDKPAALSRSPVEVAAVVWMKDGHLMGDERLQSKTQPLVSLRRSRWRRAAAGAGFVAGPPVVVRLAGRRRPAAADNPIILIALLIRTMLMMMLMAAAPGAVIIRSVAFLLETVAAPSG
jgi:hypothetical protein